MRIAVAIELTEEERTVLQKWSRGRSTPMRLVNRAKMILFASEGMQNKEIAEKLAVSRRAVGEWRKRFAEMRIQGIEKDAPRSGRKPSTPPEVVREILRKTTLEKPKGESHWSTRSMAAEVGVSHTTVSRIWKQHHLKPHRTKTFKVSNDAHFEEKLRDVVGLYISPPEHAIVLSVDEKSQIQALDRTQKSLPIYPGRLETLTHDYKRHGTTTLFAALNVLEGHVIADFKSRHRHQEWIKFLKTIDEATPPAKQVHLICDNYATHKHPKVKRWLKRHPRFHVHFTPTSSSWLNLVERWFREVTEKCIRRGTFTSVKKLQDAIWDFIDKHNENSEPFKWTAEPDEILAKVARARAKLDKIQSE
ncbi:MAG: IS630 family transposase [Planctomycetota bacterium]